MVAEQDIGVEQDVVEVHRSRCLASCGVQRVYLVKAGALVGGILAEIDGVLGIRSRGEQVVLGVGDACSHARRLVCLVVEVQLLDAFGDGRLGVGGVVYRKLFGVSQQIGVLPQESHENGVEGSHPDALCASLAHQAGDTLFHLSRRLLGEGQRQYPVGFGPIVYYVRQPAGKHPGLAAACPCHYQKRALNALYSHSLRLVQPTDYLFVATFVHATKIIEKPK